MSKVLFIVLFLAAHIASAQSSRVITGKVTNASGDPLINAAILIKGTSKGAVTNLDGEFTYTIKSNDVENVILVVSNIGYLSKEIRVGKKNNFTISLVEDVESLESIVITSSYGTKKRREEVVGSISSVKPAELGLEQPVTSVDELLQGQVAGVFIEGNPNLGEPIAINIRGQGSLTPLNANLTGTSTQPLIIVDGVLLTEEIGIEGNNFFDAGTGAFSENFLNPLARVGVQDIESIEVLKDAAAVGLYGADAANGVILITTKKGKAGKIKLNANFQTGVTTAFNGIKYMNGEQFNALRNQYNINNGNPENVREWNGIDTDWFDLLNDPGIFNRYTLGATGGSNLFRFRGSVTYQNREEAQIANDFEQWNTSLSLSYAGSKFNATLNLTPSWVTKNNPNTLYNFAVDPTIPVRNDQGDFTLFPAIGNPVAIAQQNRSEAKTFGLLGSLNLSYTWNDNWVARMIYGVDFSDKSEDRFFSGQNGTGILNDGNLGRRLLRGRDNRSWNWSANINYSNSFIDKHAVDIIAGIETRGSKADLSFTNARGFEDFTSVQPIAAANELDQEFDTSENYGRSFFSQANYNLNKTYFALINFRIDQSSAFGEDNNTAFNAGAGLSWVLSNEKFLSDSSFTDFLRLRVSYGTTGNSRIGSYAALGLYNLDNNDPFDGYNGNPSGSATLAGSAPNPNLGWERNNKFNVGIDWNFIGRFRMIVEYFNDLITDQIVSRPVLPETGFNTIQINGSSMRNSGVEFTLEANWFKQADFSWSSSFNIATLRNEVLSLVGASSAFSTAERARAQQIGTSTSSFFGFDSIGIDPATGRELFRVNGNIYDEAYVRQNFDPSDWQVIGDSQPDFYGGLRNNLSYKNFNLGIITSFSWGADQLVDRTIIDGYNVLTNRNLNVNAFFEAWRNPGDLASYPAPTTSQSIRNSSRHVYDNSNIQLRSITFSYNAPVDRWNFPLETLSFNANGSNLYYWYKEQSPDGRNGIAEFNNTYPQQRTFSIGLNATF